MAIMENHITLEISEQGSLEVPSLIKYISSKEVDGFDILDSQFPCPTTKEPQAASPGSQQDEPLIINHRRNPSVSISMPLTSEEIQLQPPNNNKKSSDETVLPQDKQWRFLLRFLVSSFGICLGVSSQAILWKTLATSPSTQFLHISPKINIILWYISVVLVATVFSIYILKLLYFEAVRREYYHLIRVNFFAPWIALLFLVLFGVPRSVTKTLHHSLWYILMVPIFFLELKIYGQWMSGGQRRLSKVANPSNHLSTVGNFVGALLGASMGLKEGPIIFIAVGLARYTVLYVTLFQRLPTNETLPKELHPVFFLFVAQHLVLLPWLGLGLRQWRIQNLS